MKEIYFFLLVLFIFGCSTTVYYVGQSYKLGTDPEVFVEESEIKQPYSIIGRGYIKSGIGPHAINWNQVQRNAIKQGWLHGADAILIMQKNAIASLPAIQSYGSIDSVSKGLQTFSRTDAYYPLSTWHDILFLKYK